MDPHDIYADINRDSFHGALPDVPVTWADLDGERYGTTQFYMDGTAAIEIDRDTVLTERMLREVVAHEMCHVDTRAEIGGEDAHGEKWRACMTRFE
jgi:predicted SprT family Zn-dependent metalloprotease